VTGVRQGTTDVVGIQGLKFLDRGSRNEGNCVYYHANASYFGGENASEEWMCVCVCVEERASQRVSALSSHPQ
jgi:hypothetical protein